MRNEQQQADFDLVSQHEARVERTVGVHGYESLSGLDRLVYSIGWLELEVNNGGFDQYFFNSAGDNVTDAIAGLETIAALQASVIVLRALSVFPPPGPSADRFTRQDQLLSLTDETREQFNHLDDRYYEYPDDIEHLLAEYLRQHSE